MMPVSGAPRLIKAKSVQHDPDVIVLDDLRRQCSDLVESARDQSRQLLAEAQFEAERLKSQAWADGFEEGRLQGARSLDEEVGERARSLATVVAREQLQPLIDALASAVTELNHRREQWLAEWDGGAIRLASALARRILLTELQMRPELATGMLHEALSLIAGRPRVCVRVHPDDVSLVPIPGDADQRLEVIPDDAISRGGCLIQLPQGTIDARLETQLQRLQDELAGDPRSC